MERVNLDTERDLGDLLGLAWSLWLAHFGVFFTLALIVVVPVDVVFDGLWAGTLGAHEFADDDRPSSSAFMAMMLAHVLLVPALVTAMHVVAVQDLGQGREPAIGRSLAVAARVALLVVVVVALYLLGTVAGLALVVPGIWFAVAGYFGAQAVVVDRLGPVAALKRSTELVRYKWWRTLGVLLLAGLITTVVFGCASAVLASTVADVSGDSATAVGIVQIVFDAVFASFTALIGTLLFFDLRARHAPSWVDSPESARA